MEDDFSEHIYSHNVEAIVMLGGMSECILVQEAVRQKILHKSVIVSDDACLAMAKGALLCGSRTCH